LITLLSVPALDPPASLRPPLFAPPPPPAFYTLSLHDALPIYPGAHAPGPGTEYLWRRRAEHAARRAARNAVAAAVDQIHATALRDRKSTRLNSSHVKISYAVFCLQKKNEIAIGAGRYASGNIA